MNIYEKINGEIERYNVFSARLLIRHASSGKMYLYDVLEIKKKRASPVRNNPYPVKTHFLYESMILQEMITVNPNILKSLRIQQAAGNNTRKGECYY